jgi:hypothetical protein
MKFQSTTRTSEPAIVRHCVLHCEHCDAIHTFLAARWIASSLCAYNDAGPRAIASNEQNATLSADRERIHATHRRTAVEIATCPRQCTVALRSNFCRHTNRMVNPQAIVLTSAQTSLADGSWGRVRARFPQRCVTMLVRSVRYRARWGLCVCSTLGDKI